MADTGGRESCSRETLIAQACAHLEQDSFPRITVAVIVALAGLSAFLTSAASLNAGLDSMGMRYGAAALGGYVVFVGLVRVWIAIRRGWEPDVEPDMAADVIEPWGGGASGGRGSGDAAGLDATGFFDGFDLDLDVLFFVIAAVLLALAGVIAVVYVVYTAPLLLAEVALDAALVSTLYRRLRREDAGSWAGAVLRRTWAPALIVVVCVSLAGFALEAAVPEAHSIGGVIRTLLA
jgi:hypothetical protein